MEILQIDFVFIRQDEFDRDGPMFVKKAINCSLIRFVTRSYMNRSRSLMQNLLLFLRPFERQYSS